MLRGVGVDFSLRDLNSIVEDHHLHLPSSIVDPREGVIVDGVDPCGVGREYFSGKYKKILFLTIDDINKFRNSVE